MIKRICSLTVFFTTLFITIILNLPYSFGEETILVEDINTSPLETDLRCTQVFQTIERLNHLKQTILFELHPSFTDSPSYDFDLLFPKNETISFPLMKTSDPLMKEQLIASKKTNITLKFEEIFSLLSNDMQIEACKKIYKENPQELAEKILNYLGKGTPQQALIINQILPYLKDELEDNLINLLRNNPQDIIERRTIIYALGRIHSEKSGSLLWNELQTTSSEEIQYTCVQALANMPHILPLEQWVQLLQYDSIPVSMTSAYAIVEYGGSYAEEYIRRILLGEFRVSQKVMEYLVDRVSNYPLDIFVPFSIEVMNKNPNLAPKFAGILHQKTGLNFGLNPQLWANWWKEYLNSSSLIENPESPPSPQDNPLPQPDVKVHQPKIRKR